MCIFLTPLLLICTIAMAEGSPGFKTWLLDLLDSLGLDGEVYGEYILGTLESSNESEPEDVREAISELLSGLMVTFCLMQDLLTYCNSLTYYICY